MSWASAASIVTDALDMGGAGGPGAIPSGVVAALAAGADLCCLGPDNDEALVEACVEAVAAAVASGELAEARVADAAARVATLRPSPEPATSARAGAALRSQAPSRVPTHGQSQPSPEPDARSGGGDPDPAVAAAAEATLAAVGVEAASRALRVDGDGPGPLVGAHVVELDRPANIAAGTVPWGVAAPLAALDPATTATRVAEGDDRATASALVAAAGRPLVVVVRDAHRRPAQAATLAALVTARPDAVVVDMGWPADATHRPPSATWITTFGASRASGEAVAGLLAGPPVSATAVSPGRTSRG